MAAPGSPPGETPAPASPTEAVPPALPGPAPAPARVDPAGQAARALASADRRYESGDFAGAVAEYRRSLAARAGAPAFVGLARALFDATPANAGEALRALDAAIKADPRYAPAFLLQGVIHQDRGRKPAARAAYQKYLQLEPAGPQAADVRQILATQLN
jgi:tetratricopeptide (TPR) repeat protein